MPAQVQTVQAVQSPISVLPRVAGEDEDWAVRSYE
jgi:hypothetical protein